VRYPPRDIPSIAIQQQVTEVTTCSINFVVQSIEMDFSFSGGDG